jgi:hypothetical protein
VSSFAHLPEQALLQILGGLLLTYFRSAHPEPADLYLFREYQMPTHDNYTAQVDWVIVDSRERRVVGAYELVTTVEQWRSKVQKLQDLAQAAGHPLQPTRFGVVVPESIASQLRQWATSRSIELVTYPA